MIILFDTSVMIAAFVESHPHHTKALSWLKRAIEKDFKWVVSAHSLLECYSVLTKLPLTPKITPSIAKLLIEENITNNAQIISLTQTDYLKLITKVAHLGLSGGIVYDALTFQAAIKIKANKILTFNVKHFQSLAALDENMIISP